MSSPPTQFERLVPTSEIPAGKMRSFELGGKQVLICHTRDGFFAVDNICSHAYARLDEGRLRGVRLICPLHGAAFDARTGQVLGAPATQPLATYPVRIVDDHVEIAVS